jgi:23S rRNA (uracil1939-C5)-methyltransferase
LYGGVGTIGLAAAKIAREVVGTEVVPVSSAYSTRNATDNGLDNFTAEEVASEKLDPALLKDTDAVIVDPPRAGLHTLVIDTLLAARPRQILYLSCNPATQARDIMALKDAYEVQSVTGYDFYPGTPHMETLVRLVAREQ